MKKYLFNIIIHSCILNGVSAQCTFENFYRYFETDNLNHKILRLSDGGYLNYGTAVKDTVDIGLTETDMVLIKTDSCGKLAWINDAGYLADGDPNMYALETDSGDIIIAGYTAAGLPGSMGNIRLGKYNKEGRLLDEKLIPGNPISAPYGIIKYHNRLIVHGRTYNIPTGKSHPLIAEVDLSLNIIKQKIFSYNEISKDLDLTSGGMHNLIALQTNDFVAVVGLGTSSRFDSYFVKLDSVFNVTYCKENTNDTIYAIGIRSMIPDKKQQYLNCQGSYMEETGSSTKNFLMRMDLSGTIQKIALLPDSLMTLTSMSPTHDGGYILGPQMVKTDSNFRIEWIKPTRGILGSVVQLPDGGYVGGGLSDARTKSWGDGFYEMYLVRTDKNGNYIRSGISEAGKGNAPQVLIYPNPANTHITIYTSLSYQAIKVYNLTGNKVFEQNYHPENTYIDIADVAQGLYILQLVGESGAILHTQKLSIQH